jgi:hypothetical protein
LFTFVIVAVPKLNCTSPIVHVVPSSDASDPDKQEFARALRAPQKKTRMAPMARTAVRRNMASPCRGLLGEQK